MVLTVKFLRAITLPSCSFHTPSLSKISQPSSTNAMSLSIVHRKPVSTSDHNSGLALCPNSTPDRHKGKRSNHGLPAGPSSDFWFNDGNIVLAAEGVFFKVHRGQLERQSEIFEDIFTVPQPLDSPTMDGCHIVELHDSPSDVRFLLKALYDGLYFKKPFADDFPFIAAVLRLSTKYIIDHLRQRCITRLLVDWPTSLAGWEAREAEATDVEGRYNPRQACAHPIMIINFAKEMGLYGFLPSAFYDLCRYGPSKVVSGIPMPENMNFPHIHTNENGNDKAVGGSNFRKSWLTLSPADLHIVLVGREAAQRTTAAFVESHLSSRAPSPDCHNISQGDGRVCRESFYFILLNVLRSVGGIAAGRDADPLFTISQAVQMMSREDFSDGTRLCALKICAACRAEFTRCVEATREEIWEQIPKWFGLEGFQHET